MSTTLRVQARESSTKGQLRQIRSKGQIPGVIYGKGLDSPSKISVDAVDLTSMLKTNPHAVIEVDIPGAGKHPVMMTDLQRDSLSRQVLHIDFHRINMNEKLTTAARLELTGTSPGEKEGGMIQLITYEIEIECYPKDIPEFISVDVSRLEIGDHMAISDLTLPSGVVAVQDPETVIVAVLAPQKERTEEELETMRDEAEENRKHSEAALAVEKG